MINFGIFSNFCASSDSLQWTVLSQIGHLMYLFATRIDPGFPIRAGDFLTISKIVRLTRFLALLAGRYM
jgi:hypothetical protein